MRNAAKGGGAGRVRAALRTTTSGIAKPELLPVANRQLPNWTAYLALNVPAQSAGFVYSDPASGRKITKLTDATLTYGNGNNTGGHDYGTGGYHISQPWGAAGNQYWCYARIEGSSAGYELLALTLNADGSVVINSRWEFPVVYWTDTNASFSPKPGEEHKLYMYHAGGPRAGTFCRFDCQSKTYDAFSKNVLAPMQSVTPGMLNDLKWMQMTQDGRYIVINSPPFGPGDTVAAYDFQTDTVTVNNAADDECMVLQDSGYVFVLKGGTLPTWNIATNTLTSNVSGSISPVHGCTLRGDNFLGTDSNAAMVRRWRSLNGATTPVETIYSFAVTQPPTSHHLDGKWNQGRSDDTQWFIQSIAQPWYVTNGGSFKLNWSLHGGSVYVSDVTNLYAGALGTIEQVVQFTDGTNAQVQTVLTKVGSIGAVSAGTYFHDTAAGKLYVRLTDSGNPQVGTLNRIRALDPFPVNSGIWFGALDGRTPRLLCHTYGVYDPETVVTVTDKYRTVFPFGHLSMDGKLIMFNSNMGVGTGRGDLFIAGVPTQ